MSYRSILVNVDIDAFPVSIIKLSVELARKFNASLIGVSAADVPPPVVTPDGMVIDGEMLLAERDAIEKRMVQLEAEFQRLVGGSVAASWRGSVDNPTRYVIEQARAADLVVTNAPLRQNQLRSADAASVTLGAGRPVLVAADNAEHLLAKTVLVAWKDTKEARRAVADSLPLLVAANEVVVATIAADPDAYVRGSVDDVLHFLKQHKIAARSEILTGSEDGERLLEVARSLRADLIVSGAYGHSRLREWAFGGVTRALLGQGNISRLMSA